MSCCLFGVVAIRRKQFAAVGRWCTRVVVTEGALWLLQLLPAASVFHDVLVHRPKPTVERHQRLHTHIHKQTGPITNKTNKSTGERKAAPKSSCNPDVTCAGSPAKYILSSFHSPHLSKKFPSKLADSVLSYPANFDTQTAKRGENVSSSAEVNSVETTKL